jgi:hypothetical protein
MASLWLSPGAGGPDYRAGRNRKIPATEVHDALVARFGPDHVREDTITFLDGMCRAYESGRTPDSIEHSLADCALALITDVAELDAPPELVARIVRRFPPAVWHFPVGLLISRHLTFEPLVETLLAGINAPPHPAALDDALTGFRLYLGKARADEDAGPRKEAPAVMQALARIDQLADSDDPEIARLAMNARKALENHAGLTP